MILLYNLKRLLNFAVAYVSLDHPTSVLIQSNDLFKNVNVSCLLKMEIIYLR